MTTQDQIQNVKNELLSVNRRTKDRNSIMGEAWCNMIGDIEMRAKEVGNSFIESVSQSMYKYMSASEKQAYCVARFAVEQGMTFED